VPIDKSFAVDPLSLNEINLTVAKFSHFNFSTGVHIVQFAGYPKLHSSEGR
jgi:hypothetical protein